VGAGHEGGHLFVPRLDEFDLSLRASQRPEHAVDAIAGITKNPPHAPGLQPGYEEVADRLFHESS
jgi:hypothetical protein